jgi:1,4-dihydroxy-2-naphthoate octaprenyltransferase
VNSVAPSPAALDIAPGSAAAWAVALRPKTFWIAITPVLVGTALALAETGRFEAWVALATLAGSVLMQVITNLQNDVGYTVRGAERVSRTGLPRATARGWVTVRQARAAMLVAAVVAMLVGLPLIARGGWPVLVMGLSSMFAAYSYMGGPRPIAYTPLGELMVLVFFGFVAVGGTYYLQAGQLSWIALAGGGALGLMAAAVLAVNNYRDRAHDAEVGRRTLAVVMGAHGFERLYALLMLAPFAVVVLLAVSSSARLPLLISIAVLPAALGLVRLLPRTQGAAFNGLLFSTVKLELVFGVLLTLGALVQAAVSRGLPLAG